MATTILRQPNHKNVPRKSLPVCYYHVFRENIFAFLMFFPHVLLSTEFSMESLGIDEIL